MIKIFYIKNKNTINYIIVKIFKAKKNIKKYGISIFSETLPQVLKKTNKSENTLLHFKTRT